MFVTRGIDAIIKLSISFFCVVFFYVITIHDVFIVNSIYGFIISLSLSLSIGPQDINEHNLKLMLGLVWTLIQRYQLGIGAPEEERSPPPQAAATAATPGAKAAPKEKKPKEKKKPSQSAKAILLGWVNATLPDIGVKNFTTDWNDGRKISALVDSMKPGLIPDHATLNPDDRLENTSRALDLAEEHFGVPQVRERIQ